MATVATAALAAASESNVNCSLSAPAIGWDGTITSQFGQKLVHEAATRKKFYLCPVQALVAVGKPWAVLRQHQLGTISDGAS